MKTSKNKYIKKDNIIYRWSPEKLIFIQMTGVKNNKDRRFTCEELGIHNFYNDYDYPRQKARTEINEYWNNLKSEWDYNGYTFNNSHPMAYFERKVSKYTGDEFNAWSIHTEIPMIKTKYGKYYLVWHQGKLYFMSPYHYLPQCCLYEFKSDCTPGRFIKWTHIKNCKAIWNKTLKTYFNI